MEKMLLILNAIAPLSPALQEYLISILKPRRFSRKDIIQKEGAIANYIYFIETGLVRSYYNKRSKEISSWFMKEMDFFVSVQSFFQQNPSYETIEALEDCILWGISYEQLQYIYKKFPEFNLHRAVVLEKYYCLSEARHHLTLMQSATDKYLDLLKNNPDLINRVKGVYLCSYLGVTPETLSRIRSSYTISGKKL